MRMRVLLLGGESRLGQSLLAQAAAESIVIDAESCPPGGWLPDVLEPIIDRVRPDLVINLAFYHQQFQLGEQDPLLLASQHAFSERVIELCRDRQMVPFLLSSTRVFDGRKVGLYAEKDEVAPADPLGQLQAALERCAQDSTRRHLILRLSWVLDSSPQGLLGRLLGLIYNGGPLQLAEEWRGNPTPIDDVARVMLALLKQLDCEAPLHGIYHYGSSEASSWISFAGSLIQELLATQRLDRDPQVQPIPFQNQALAGKEPQNASLASRRILMACGVKPRPWRSQLGALVDAMDGIKHK
jgi:dTDP-4-dehydrorhamnose reductase